MQLLCATQLFIVDERHVQQVLDEYVAYFNACRPHQGLGQRPPCGSVPPALSNPTGRIMSLGRGAVAIPKMTFTTNDSRFVADFEIGDVDPVDYQPEIDEVLREAFELEGAPVPDWLQRDDGQDDIGPGPLDLSDSAKRRTTHGRAQLGPFDESSARPSSPR